MSAAVDPVRSAKGRLGYYSGRPDATPEKIEAARRDLKEAKLARHIKEALASAPPLTDTQRKNLALLLVTGAK